MDKPDDPLAAAEIAYEDVSVDFGSSRPVGSFSRTIEAGAKIVLYGPSGSGKSTLLRLLLGFVAPTGGRVLVDGRAIDSHTVWDVRARMAYVPQVTDPGGGTARGLVDEVFAFKRNEPLAPTREDLAAAADRLDLDVGLLDQPLAELSGGERQRVTVMISLLLKRKTYLLDEATASLDEELKERVVQIFGEAPDWTVIAVSHDPAWRDGDRFTIVPREEWQ